MAPAKVSADKALVERIRTFQRSNKANKRCADCQELGPTYVCLDFHTFVCQTCSGIHREFGHKVKSISLSEWASWELEALELGGNERATRMWLARWSHDVFPEPDSSEMDRVREFIRLKYREKKWYRPESKRPSVESAEAAPAGNSAPGAAPAIAETVSSVPAMPAPEVQKKAAVVADLLSGGATAPPEPAPSAAASGAFLVPPPSGAHVPWTADFGTPVKSAPTGGNIMEGLIDLDFSPTPAPKTIDNPIIPDLCCFADDLIGTPLKSPSVLKPQDLDDNSMMKPTVAEPAEEPAPTACGSRAEDGELSIADQLREAVLRGSADDLMRLFKQCSEVPKRPTYDENRFAAFAAFDELGAIGSTEPEQEKPAVGGLESPTAVSARSAMAFAQFSPSRPSPTSNTSPGPQCFFIGEGDDDEAPAGHSPRLSPSPVSAAACPLTQSPGSAPKGGSSQWPPAMPSGSPPRDVIPTPQQLEQLNPQELVQLQAMITRALQARGAPLQAPLQAQLAPQPAPQRVLRAAPQPPQAQTQAWSTVQVPRLPGSASLQGGAFPSAPQDLPRSPSPPKQFGDLLAAFHERNPISGFELAS